MVDHKRGIPLNWKSIVSSDYLISSAVSPHVAHESSSEVGVSICSEGSDTLLMIQQLQLLFFSHECLSSRCIDSSWSWQLPFCKSKSACPVLTQHPPPATLGNSCEGNVGWRTVWSTCLHKSNVLKHPTQSSNTEVWNTLSSMGYHSHAA